jgi:hypothetical protein
VICQPASWDLYLLPFFYSVPVAGGRSLLYRLFCTGGINPSDPWNPLDNRDNGAMVFCRDKIGQYVKHTKYVYIKSTTVYVPSSELGLSQPLSRQRVCPSPQNRVWGGGHTRLRVRGWGSPKADDWRKSYLLCGKTDMEFLDINLTKDSSFLLHAIHSAFYRRILISGFKNRYKKSGKQENSSLFRGVAFCITGKRG